MVPIGKSDFRGRWSFDNHKKSFKHTDMIMAYRLP